MRLDDIFRCEQWTYFALNKLADILLVTFFSVYMTPHGVIGPQGFNIRRFEQNGHHFTEDIFADDVFKRIDLILYFVSNFTEICLTSSRLALVQVIAWCRFGAKTLHKTEKPSAEPTSNSWILNFTFYKLKRERGTSSLEVAMHPMTEMSYDIYRVISHLLVHIGYHLTTPVNVEINTGWVVNVLQGRVVNLKPK